MPNVPGNPGDPGPARPVNSNGAPVPAAGKPPETAPARASGEGPGTAPELIEIDEFARLDLRVARIVSAEAHPKADRLLKMQVDLGGETRQLVAGIAGSYRPEQLAGRLIVVVANLKPARLRGETSQGMLLAASSGETVSLLQPDQEVPPGARVR
jgi:methionyl-tRNA synthetase